MKDEALRLLRRLSEAFGAPGAEGPVRQIVAEEMNGPLRSDRMGSIICEKRGSAARPRIMLAAHLDEIGGAVQDITEDGFLRFVTLGGWWGHVLLGQRVRVRTRSGVERLGVVASKSVHMLEDSERDKVIKPEEMFVDIGARTADEARGVLGVALGDPLVPDAAFGSLANPDLLVGKAFDDRAGVAMLIQVAQALERLPHASTVYAVGTVQEELGTRGAGTAVHCIDPDVAIILEGVPADDFPGASKGGRQGALEKGAQVRILDPSALMNRKLTECILDCARLHNIPTQVAVRRSGGTDARPIHVHASGVPTAVIGVPVRYAHAHHGVMNINDYLACLRLVVEVVTRLDGAAVRSFTEFDL